MTRLSLRIGHVILPTLAALLFACGDSVTQSGAGGSGASGGAGGGTATTTAVGGAGGGGTGGAPECSAYAWPEGPLVTIHVVNQTGAPIYVPTGAACGYSETLSIVDSVGNESKLLEPGTGCGSWCALFLDPSDCLCEVTPSCNNEALRIEAGESYDSMWSGLVDESTTMPAQCVSPGCPVVGAPTCLWSVAPVGAVTITARAWTEMSCGACACDPNHPEACVVSGVVGGTKISATATVAEVAPGTVEVVFQ